MLIIWDVDGTIADPWPHYKAACARVIGRRNLPDTPDCLLKRGFGHHEPIDYGWGLPLEEQAKIRFETYDEFRVVITEKQMPLFGWVKEVLSISRAQGHAHAIATNRPRDLTEDLLSHYAIADYFSCIAHGDLVAEKNLRFKPAPDFLHHVLEQTGHAAANALFVGDTEGDLMAAKAAGMRSIAVGWGMHNEQELKSRNPDAFVRSADELERALNLLRA